VSVLTPRTGVPSHVVWSPRSTTSMPCLLLAIAYGISVQYPDKAEVHGLKHPNRHWTRRDLYTRVRAFRWTYTSGQKPAVRWHGTAHQRPGRAAPTLERLLREKSDRICRSSDPLRYLLLKRWIVPQSLVTTVSAPCPLQSSTSPMWREMCSSCLLKLRILQIGQACNISTGCSHVCRRRPLLLCSISWRFDWPVLIGPGKRLHAILCWVYLGQFPSGFTRLLTRFSLYVKPEQVFLHVRDSHEPSLPARVPRYL
jgi:hypothetical protein